MLERLKKRYQFLKVAQAYNTSKRPTLIIQCSPSVDKDINYIRVGFTASKRVGNAVRRNRAKRRLRALAELFLLEKWSESGLIPCDFVFIAVPATVDASFSDLKRDFFYAIELCKNRITR